MKCRRCGCPVAQMVTTDDSEPVAWAECDRCGSNDVGGEE